MNGQILIEFHQNSLGQIAKGLYKNQISPLTPVGARHTGSLGRRFGRKILTVEAPSAEKIGTVR